MPPANVARAQDTPTPVPARTGDREDKFDELVKSISWEAVWALAGSALVGGVSYALGRMCAARTEQQEREQLRSGDRMNGNTRVHIHTLVTLPDGSRALVFRPIPPAGRWEEVLKSPVLAQEVRDAAQHTTAENPVLSISDKYLTPLITELRNAISVENRSVPGRQKEFLLFVTCEDSKNAISEFQTAIRVFLITPDDLGYFANLDSVRGTKVDQQSYAFRLLALHSLAKGVAEGVLVEGKQYTRIMLPAREDDGPLSTSAPVDWGAVHNKYAQHMEESRALRQLADPG